MIRENYQMMTIDLQGVAAELIYSMKGEEKVREKTFNSLRRLSTKLEDQKVVNIGLGIMIGLKDQQISREILEQFKALFRRKTIEKSAKKSAWISLELSFDGDVLASPWTQVLAELVWKQVRFENLTIRWAQHPVDLDQAMEALWKYNDPSKTPRYTPLRLWFETEDSNAAGNALKALSDLVDNSPWPLTNVTLSLTNLVMDDIPGHLKDVLPKQTDNLKILFTNQRFDGRFCIDSDTMEYLLDVFSSKSHITFKDLKVELNQQVVDKYFNQRNPEKTLVFNGNGLEVAAMMELGDAWSLELTKEAGRVETEAKFQRSSSQILVSLQPEQIMELLSLRQAQCVNLNDSSLGLTNIINFLSFQQSTQIGLTTGKTKERCFIQSGVSRLTLRESLDETIEAMEEALKDNGIPNLELLCFMPNPEEVTDPNILRLASFKEHLATVRADIDFKEFHGQVLGFKQNSQNEFTVDKIIKRKIDDAVRTGKVLTYSRPQLLMLGSVGSGKTSLLRALLGFPHQREDVQPTFLAVNKWDVKIRKLRDNQSEWETSEVDEMNNGMASDLADLTSSINYKNTSFVFKSAVALKSRQNKASALKNSRSTIRRKKTGVDNRTLTVQNSNTMPPKHDLGYSKLSIWDTSGVDRIITDQLMVERGIYVLAIDLQKYDATGDEFQEELKEWIDYIDENAEEYFLVIAGTHSNGIPEQLLSEINKSMRQVIETANCKRIATNTQQGQEYFFYPVDSLNVVHDQIVALRGAVTNHLPWLTEEIPVSWLYFMDHFFQNEKTFASMQEMEGVALDCGIQLRVVPWIIRKYTRMGAILSVQEKNGLKLSSDLIVLKPQKFIEVLTGVLQSTNDNGILTSAVLQDCVTRSFPDQESRHRFSQFCGDALILSRWITATGDTNSIFVPYRNIETAPNTFNLPNAELCWSLFVSWEQSPPKSYFERFLGLLVEANADLGGGVTPKTFEKYAKFNCRGFEFYVIRHTSDIELRFKRDDSNQFLPLAASLELFCDCMRDRGLMRPSVTVESNTTKYIRKPDKIHVRWKDVSETLRNSKFTVPAFGYDLQLKDTTVEQYLDLIEPDKKPLSSSEICIIHDWGVYDNSSNTFPDHEQALEITRLLRSQDDNTSFWVDENGFEGFDVQLAETAIISSKITILLLTNHVLKQLHNPKSSTYFQIVSAFKKGVQTIVPLAMEANVVLRENWEDSILGLNFCDPSIKMLEDVSQLDATEIVSTIRAKTKKMRRIMKYMANFGPSSRSSLVSVQLPWLKEKKEWQT